MSDKSKYPYIVDGRKYSFFQKLMARTNITDVNLGNGVFLGYCKDHKIYYEDVKHGKGKTRCPICDEEWVRRLK